MTLRVGFVGLVLFTASTVDAQAPGVTYIQDPAGRLVAVVDPSGGVATYAYDAVGNITAIARATDAQRSVITFTPACGGPGTPVTIRGTGFNPQTSANTVTFPNGPGTVVSAGMPTGTGQYASELVATVPSGASSSGLLTVNGVQSTATFQVGCGQPLLTGAPSITSLSSSSTSLSGQAVAAVLTDTVVITGSNLPSRSVALGTDPPDYPNSGNLTFNLTDSDFDGTQSPTQLSTFVPETATAGKVTVTTPFGTAVSVQNLFVTPPRLLWSCPGVSDPACTSYGNPYAANNVDAAGRIAIGGTATTMIKTKGNIAMLLFDGTLGQRVSIWGPGGPTGNTACWRLNVVDPYRGEQSIRRPACAANTFFLQPYTLDVTGTYTLFLDDPHPAPTAPPTNTGQGEVDLYAVVPGPGAPGPGIMASGPPLQITTGTAGQATEFFFTEPAGKQVSLQVTNTMPCCGSVVSLYAPGGQVFVSGANIDAGAIIDVPLPPVDSSSAPSQYAILLQPGPGRTGQARFTLSDGPVGPSPITIGGPPLTAAITTSGQPATLTFSGKAQTQISLTMSNETFPVGPALVSIANPDTTPLVAATTSPTITLPVLPQTGSYTISITAPSFCAGNCSNHYTACTSDTDCSGCNKPIGSCGPDTGAVTLTLTCLRGPC